MILVDIGEKIKECRERMGLTQKQLAVQLSVTQASMSAYEQGIAIPTTESVCKMCLIFEQPSDYFIGLDNRKKIAVDGLSQKQQELLHELIGAYLRRKK